MNNITVVRIVQGRYSAFSQRKWDMYIDGNYVEGIKNGDKKIIPIDSGIHSFHILVANRYASNTIVIDCNRNNIIEVGTLLDTWWKTQFSLLPLIMTYSFYAKLLKSGDATEPRCDVDGAIH